MLTREDILFYLKENKAYLRNQFKVVEIGIFGSFARGEATEDSDIDVLVNFEKDTLGLFELKFYLSEYLAAHFNRKVEIARPVSIKDSARESVFRDVIYA
jgi:uncharacterized protein